MYKGCFLRRYIIFYHQQQFNQQSILLFQFHLCLHFPYLLTTLTLHNQYLPITSINSTENLIAKMQFTLALVAAIFASGITAAPALEARNAVPSITVSITNDQTGASASATVRGDGIARNLTDLFGGSAIDQHGAIVGTSAQLTKFSDNTKCFFQNVNWIINFDGKKTFVDLDGNKDVALPVYLNGFNLQCV
jgi:hypothetical protein